MIVELKQAASGADIERVTALLNGEFRTIKALEFDGRRFLGVSGAREDLDPGAIASHPAVLATSQNDATTYFTRRSFKDLRTEIAIGERRLGGDDMLIIAGPCTVEGPDELWRTAEAVKRLGVHAFRAGAFKPRTSPYNFQGLGREGLAMLGTIGKEFSLPIVSEILDPRDVGLAEDHIDVIQVGTRNMTNQALLKAIGGSKLPTIIKRGSSSKLDELVRAAEFVMYGGNPNVALCERGIQTFENATRSTLDVSAVPVLRRTTHLPIVIDPSHAAGERAYVEPLALAAAVVGADALLIECHVDPGMMIKPGDGPQALRPDDLEALLEKIEAVLRSVGRRLAPRL